MWQPAQSAKLPDFGAGAAEMERGGDPKRVPSGAPNPRRGLLWGTKVRCLAALGKKRAKISRNRNEKDFSFG